MSDRLETCSSLVKRRSCRYLFILHPGARAVLPHTIGISNGLSHTLEVYRKVLTYSIVYQRAPCVRLCIRQHYYRFELPHTLSISGDPTRVPWLSCLDPYTKNSIQGDYYAHTLEVYHKWHLPDNPSERPNL